MANTTIQLKKSATPTSTPAALANGELAINYADGKLYYKNLTGQIVSFNSTIVTPASFSTVNANGSLVVAPGANSTLTLVAGSGISMTSDIINDIITISSTANLKLAYDQANLAYSQANTKVDTITSNSTSRIWTNSVVTSGIETVYLDLANTGVTAGVYGNSSIIPIITVDAYGRVTSIANVASAGGTGGSASVNVGTTAPSAPTAGNLWWNTNEGVLYIYYTDADSSQWVQASPTTNPQPVVTGGYYQGNRGSIGDVAGLSDIFRVHANTITADITIPGGYNALAAGPLTIQTGKKLTIGTGARAVIV